MKLPANSNYKASNEDNLKTLHYCGKHVNHYILQKKWCQKSVYCSLPCMSFRHDWPKIMLKLWERLLSHRAGYHILSCQCTWFFLSDIFGCYTTF